MTRSFIKLIFFRAGLLLFISLLILASGRLFITFRQDAQLQKRLLEEMSDYIVADYFIVLDSEEYDQFSNIDSVIVAYDNLARPIHYIVDVNVSEHTSELQMRIFLSEDAEIIDFIQILNLHMDNKPSDNDIDMLCAQFERARIPVALTAIYQEEFLAQNEYLPIEGLHDGIFYAELDAYNSAGYKDFVILTVENRRIVDVVWDAFAQDQGKNRAQASVDGEFPMPEGQLIWAAQAFAVQNKLIEVQDPLNLAIRSDGRTEIIEGVDINLQVFINLVNRCIEDSLLNNVMLQEDRINFEDEIPLYIPESAPTSSFAESPTDEFDRENILFGEEDGVVNLGDEDRYISESVDGLALSEIRTQIEGLEDDVVLSSLMVSGVNEAYKFVRVYLRWGG